MPDPVESFWPEEISDNVDPPPVALLKEQAALLGSKTGNNIEGVVKTSIEGGTVYHSLYLKAESLGDYLYKLLYIAHPAFQGGADVFPLTAQNSFGDQPNTIGDDSTFRDWLRAELSSISVRSAIGNLLRYIRESQRPSRAS